MAIGFNIGDLVVIKCEDGKFIITLDLERRVLMGDEKRFIKMEAKKLHEPFLKKKKYFELSFGLSGFISSALIKINQLVMIMNKCYH